jgi:hypothetical protein
MRDKVLVNLNGGDPGLPFIRYPSLATYAHDHIVVMHAVDHVF